ncbi:fasciclin domain-containing protein [Dyadobacter sp. 22481]|uniref:fasciclin domain-containing protein n=1 Tax=Dyadobacter sp. 22481 TaxID=3453926 RepID=UPI003F880044
MKKYLFGNFFVIGGLLFFSCSEKEQDIVKAKSITEVISSNPEFSTLYSIIQYADMSDTLSVGTFTMFAPSNTALEKVKISGTSEITKIPKDSVKKFIKQHLISKKIVYSELSTGQLLSISKQKLTVTKDSDNNDILVNSNRVVTKDVNASNGILQVIDSVLVKIK